MNTICLPVSIEKSPEARGSSGLLTCRTYRNPKNQLVRKIPVRFWTCTLHSSAVPTVNLKSDYTAGNARNQPCLFQHQISDSSPPHKCSSTLTAPLPVIMSKQNFNQNFILPKSLSPFSLVLTFNNPTKNAGDKSEIVSNGIRETDVIPMT